MSHSLLLNCYGAEAQEDFFSGKPYALAAAAAMPPGIAEPTEGGFNVSGRWRFASGVMHAGWVLLSANSPTGPMSVAIPTDEVTIVDTWHVPGMKGTGSNDVQADKVFVPTHRTVDFIKFASDSSVSVAGSSYSLLKYPVNRLLPVIHAAVALGAADAALELFRENIVKRVRMQTRGRVADEPLIQSSFGKAWDLVHVAGLQLQDAIDLTDAIYGPAPTREGNLEDRAVMNMGVSGAGTKAFAAIDLVVQASGASIFRTGDPLERIARDALVMRNHASADFASMSHVAGGVLLGQGLGDYAEPLF